MELYKFLENSMYAVLLRNNNECLLLCLERNADNYTD